MTPTQTGDKPMVTQRAIELLERAHAKGGLGYEARGAIEYAINVLRHRAQETLSPEQPRPCAVCGDGLTTQIGASLKSKAESAATWMRRAATAEIELIQAREGLQKIATGGIDGEPSNSRDTLHIVRQIATDTLAALSSSPDLAEENERLRPMEDAPKDGRYIIAAYRSLDGYAEQLHGRSFIIRHEGTTPSGYDLGWALFPGHGGVPDKCFSGWLPLPTTLQSISTTKGNP